MEKLKLEKLSLETKLLELKEKLEILMTENVQSNFEKQKLTSSIDQMEESLNRFERSSKELNQVLDQLKDDHEKEKQRIIEAVNIENKLLKERITDLTKSIDNRK